MMITIQRCAEIVGRAGDKDIVERGPIVDVSRRIIAESDIDLTQERERDAFERVVSDMNLELGNIDGSIAEALTPVSPQSAWDVCVYDGRKLFWGYIASPITFDLKAKEVRFRTYSIDRLWIDLCKITPIPPYKYTDKVYATLEEILDRVMIGEGRPLTQLGITQIVVDDIYKNRKVRDSKYSSESDIGNHGRFTHLDPTTTVKELLDAIALYYNAEFIVDPDSGAFRMKQRRLALEDTEHNLDAVIMNDGKIEYDNSDQKTYDFVKLTIGVEKPGVPVYQEKWVPIKYDYDASGTIPVAYRYSNVIVSGGVEIESELSDPFVMEYKFSGVMHMIQAPVFAIPAPPAGTVRQNIYRLKNDEWFELYTSFTADSNRLIFIDPKFEFTGPVLKPFTPITQSGKVGTGLDQNGIGNIYMSYNEVNGVWNENIVETPSNAVPKDGLIFEVNPQLRFYDENFQAVMKYSIIEVFAFFGRETNVEEFKEQWIDLFRTRKPLRCTVAGTNYKYGDTFVSSKKIPGKFVVKKAVNKLMKKETELELLTI